MEKNPTWAKGFLRKATALQALRRTEEAASAIEDGLKLEPDENNAPTRPSFLALEEELRKPEVKEPLPQEREVLDFSILDAEPWLKRLPLIQPQDKLGQLVPKLMKRMKNNDFCVALSFQPDFIERLFYAGFLPIAEKVQERGTESDSSVGNDQAAAARYYLLPKLHSNRCILQFENLHVSKKVRQRAKKYEVSVDTCFSEVVQRCMDQHGENWLFPPMRKALQTLHDRGQQKKQTKGGTPEQKDGEKAEGGGKGKATGKGSSKAVAAGQGQGQVFLHSIEVWRVSDGKLVAGEIGTQVGAWYTSLSAFTETDLTPPPSSKSKSTSTSTSKSAEPPAAANASSAGTIQCCCVAIMLKQCGFRCWDLGMEMDYK